MPVNEKQQSGEILYQRQQYEKGGIGRKYWDYRDSRTISLLDENDSIILDCGYGEGITLEKIVNNFHDNKIIGFDIIFENARISRKYHLPVCVGDIYSLGCKSNSVDAVFMMEVIEHIEDPQKAIHEIYRVLKKNGKLIMVYPNDWMFMVSRILTLKFKEAFYDPGHVRQWNPKDINSFLTKHGFKVTHSDNIPFKVWQFSLHSIVCAIKI